MSLADVFTDSSDDVKRERLMSLYAGSMEEIETAIKEDPDFTLMYTGMKRHMLSFLLWNFYKHFCFQIIYLFLSSFFYIL